MSKEFTTQGNNRIFVVGVDMENRSPEDIARDAAMQIGDIFDRLIQEKKETKDGQTSKTDGDI